MKLKLASLCILLCLVGCTEEPKITSEAGPFDDETTIPSARYEDETTIPSARYELEDHYELKVSPEQISSAYSAHWQKRQDEKNKLIFNADENIAAIASNIKTCYAKGLPEMAKSLIDRHPRIYTWEQAQDIVDISCVYQPRYLGGNMQIKIVPKQPLSEDIVVCFPPGLYGKALDPEPKPYGVARKVQDLGILEAPVIQARNSTKTTVRIACLTYSVKAPSFRTTYILHKTPKDDGVYQLLVEICTGKFSGPDIQLALWVVGNKLSWEDFLSGRSMVTFRGHNVTSFGASDGAADLIIKAGIDPSTTPYFGGKGEPKRLKTPAIPPVKPKPPESKEIPKIRIPDVSS